jgi:hypothetical protein
VKSGTPQRPRRSQSQGNKRRRRLNLSVAGVIPKRVPKRWVKLIVGVFLIPPALVLTQTFFTAFARTTVRDRFWITEEFWFFSLGVLLWMVAFFGLPRPQWLYVFGHELTHALWVTLLGGKVHRFQVGSKGGHVLSDRTNTWIALAPYFFPIYSLLAISIFGFCGLFVDMSPYRCVLYAVIGATWAMHTSFTCWMIPKGQPDLHYGGTFFSVMVIYVMNLALLAALLIVASPQLTWLGFATELLEDAVSLTHWATLVVAQLFR